MATQAAATQFLPTPSARRATPGHGCPNFKAVIISTHALREEGDPPRPSEAPADRRYFYPRPPRGGRPFMVVMLEKSRLFLPTPSARRATRGRTPP